MRKILSRFFIITGLLILLASAGLVAYNLYDGWRAEQASQSIIDQIQDMAEENAEENSQEEELETPIYELYPELEMPAIEIDGYRYIATLEIPSINITLPIMEEWDYDRLKISPCRYSGSAYTNDLVIAGHNYAKHFSQIKWMKDGTVIILKDMAQNTFHYKVAYSEVIAPEEIESMTTKKEEEEWDMTLFTCTTGGGSRHAVRCVLDEE